MDMPANIDHVFRDQRAFAERVLRRFGVPERDVADATQDVFVVVHRKLATFEGRSSASTWIYRIAFHVASQYRRRACNRHEILGEAETVNTTTFDHERQELVDNALRSLNQLDPEKRDVFVDFELRDEPMAAIAERLHVPLKTAFSRLYAARRDLLRRLRDSGFAALWLPNASMKHSAWSLSAVGGIAAWVLLSLPAVPTPLVLAPTRGMEPSTRAPMYELVAVVESPPPLPIQASVRSHARDARPEVAPATEPTPTSTSESLVVFRDSEAELMPTLPPPILTELAPAAAREPRIQLRGRHAVRLR